MRDAFRGWSRRTRTPKGHRPGTLSPNTCLGPMNRWRLGTCQASRWTPRGPKRPFNQHRTQWPNPHGRWTCNRGWATRRDTAFELLFPPVGGPSFPIDHCQVGSRSSSSGKPCVIQSSTPTMGMISMKFAPPWSLTSIVPGPFCFALLK